MSIWQRHQSVSAAQARHTILKVGLISVLMTFLALVGTLGADYAITPKQHVQHIVLSAIAFACAIGYVLTSWFLVPRK